MVALLAAGLGYIIAGLIWLLLWVARVVLAGAGPAVICYGIDQASRPAAIIAAGVSITGIVVLFTAPIKGGK